MEVAPPAILHKAQQAEAKFKKDKAAKERNQHEGGNASGANGSSGSKDPEVAKLRKRVAELEREAADKSSEPAMGQSDGTNVGDVDLATKISSYEGIIKHKQLLGECCKSEEEKLGLLKKQKAAPVSSRKLLGKRDAAQKTHTKAVERQAAAAEELAEADEALVKAAAELAQAEKSLQDQLLVEGNKAAPSVLLAGVLNAFQEDQEFLEEPGVKDCVTDLQKLVSSLDGLIKMQQDFSQSRSKEQLRRKEEDEKNANLLDQQQKEIIQRQQQAAATAATAGGAAATLPTGAAAPAAMEVDAETILTLLQESGATITPEGKALFGEALAKKRKTMEGGQSS